MAYDRVDEPGHADTVQQVADKAGAADHGSRGYSGAGVGECELEYPQCQESDARAFIGGWGALKEEVMVAYEPVAAAEHEGEAKCPEQQAAEAGVNYAFHQNVDGFARAAKSSFKHSEADLHAEHQECRDQRPHGIQWIDNVVSTYNGGIVGFYDSGPQQARDGG